MDKEYLIRGSGITLQRREAITLGIQGVVVTVLDSTVGGPCDWHILVFAASKLGKTATMSNELTYQHETPN